MIAKCTCKNSFQDETYGSQNSVFNECLKSRMRCTVCGAEKDQGAREEAAKQTKTAKGKKK